MAVSAAPLHFERKMNLYTLFSNIVHKNFLIFPSLDITVRACEGRKQISRSTNLCVWFRIFLILQYLRWSTCYLTFSNSAINRNGNNFVIFTIFQTIDKRAHFIIGGTFSPIAGDALENRKFKRKFADKWGKCMAPFLFWIIFLGATNELLEKQSHFRKMLRQN